jgi:hypothetical protein
VVGYLVVGGFIYGLRAGLPAPPSMLPVSSATRALIRATRDSIAAHC